MWPAPENLIRGLDDWKSGLIYGKSGLNGEHTDFWAKAEGLWSGFTAIWHGCVVTMWTCRALHWQLSSHSGPSVWLETVSWNMYFGETVETPQVGLHVVKFPDEFGKTECIKMGVKIWMKESLLPLLSFPQLPESKKIPAVESEWEMSMFPAL